MKRVPRSVSPWRFLGTEELAAEMNLSVNAIRGLRGAGAPFIAKKSHPRLLLEWMARHPDDVPKLD